MGGKCEGKMGARGRDGRKEGNGEAWDKKRIVRKERKR